MQGCSDAEMQWRRGAEKQRVQRVQRVHVEDQPRGLELSSEKNLKGVQRCRGAKNAEVQRCRSAENAEDTRGDALEVPGQFDVSCLQIVNRLNEIYNEKIPKNLPVEQKGKVDQDERY